MSGRALDAARQSGLVFPGEPLLVMLSGGADSVCLLHAAREIGARVSAVHVNYGLRPEAADDEAHCRDLCSSLGVELVVERAWLPPEGNMHAHAREARYRIAERVAEADYAAAHTASDQAETVLYRLAVSPGSRALLGMRPRRGRLVRPLLGATREDTREHCTEHGLTWRDDASNEDPRFARTRVRGELLPALRSLSPAAELTIAETARQLREEGELLDAAVRDALAGVGGGPAVELGALRELHPGLRRLVLRALAEEAAGAQRPLSADEAEAIVALGDAGGTRTLDLAGGLRAVSEYGVLRFRPSAEPVPAEPVDLPVPGAARFGRWEVEAGAPPGEVTVAAEALGGPLTVRAWRDGDRMRPVGLGGTKTLQDLFTDRKVPRELRRSLPVVEAGGGIVWVAGVALDERFAAADDDPTAVGLSARRLPRP